MASDGGGPGSITFGSFFGGGISPSSAARPVTAVSARIAMVGKKGGGIRFMIEYPITNNPRIGNAALFLLQ
jgi:hypothetical protein